MKNLKAVFKEKFFIKITPLLFLMACGLGLSAQICVVAGTMTIGASSQVFVQGDVQIKLGATMKHLGNLNLTGNFDNFGTYTATGAASTLVFSGTSDATIRTKNKVVNKLFLEKTATANLTILDNLSIADELKFSNDNNFVLLGTRILTLKNTGIITGATANRFVVTNGTGSLKKMACTNFTFPVGFSATTFNPVGIVENGTPDTKGVRCMANPLTKGATGVPINNGVVAAAWQITEAPAGGSSSNLTFQWAGSDQLPAFSNSNCTVYRYASSWTAAGAAGAATGSDPFSKNLNGAAAFGYFMVGTPGAFFAPPTDDRSDENLAENLEKTEAEIADFQVMPNPFSNLLKIRLAELAEQDFSVQIFDLSGKLAAEKTWPARTQTIEIQSNEWQAGVYFIQIKNASGEPVQTLRAVKTE